MQLRLLKYSDNLIPPTRAHYNDSGADCFALQDYTLKPFESVLINLGFGVDIPNGYELQLRAKSSFNAKGIITQFGTIDSGYTGEIKAVLINTTPNNYEIKKGDKICQIVLSPVIYADYVFELGENRQTGGFGSTGR